ncbi:hypothetical protein ACIKTA_03660 [Hansschlegelia beijingensis]
MTTPLPPQSREEIEAEIARLREEAHDAEFSADGRLNDGRGSYSTESAINWLLKREAARCRAEADDLERQFSGMGGEGEADGRT